MTEDLKAWRLGEPLSISLENLAVGGSSVRTINVGRIVWSAQRRRAIFEPAVEAIADALPLSPHSFAMEHGLKPGDPAEFGGLHGVFADSLPDGWGTLLVDREAEARGLRRSDLTPVDRLAIVGFTGMGALAYRPEADRANNEEFRELSQLADAAERVIANADAPCIADAITLRKALGGSGGARPKVVCQIEETDTDEAELRSAHAPADTRFGHWLVKFTSSEDGPEAAQIEYGYGLMARAAGIAIPDQKLITSKDGRKFFAVRRFDRDVITDGEQDALRRRHMLSVSGALENEHRHFGFSYSELLIWIYDLTKDVRQVEEAFRRAAFNAMAHNRDDHGRQHSALLDLDEDGQWRWQMSPAYDLTPSDGPGGQHSLSIGGVGTGIKKEHLLKLAAETPMLKTRAVEIIDQVSEAVGRWPKFADEASVSMAAARRVAKLHFS